MMFAETASSRPLVSVAATGAGLIAGMIIALTTPPPEVVRHDRGAITPMRGCVERAKPAVHPKRVHDGRTSMPYRDVLQGASAQMQACVTGADVGYRVALVIGATGKVTSVEVKADATDMANIDLKSIKCLEGAVSQLGFPQAPHEVRLSTYVSLR